jgi:hypothetical protein
MNTRFLSPTLHGIVDYAAAAGLLTMPFVLGLGTSSPLAKWLAPATGIAVILTSLATNYRFGLFRVLPFKGHLAIDTAVAAAFAVVPTLGGFWGLDAWYYWLNSAAVFAVVGLSQVTDEAPEPAHA